MLVQRSWELIERCYEQTPGLWEMEDFKDAFIEYVFGPYQEEVLTKYDSETFYRHLEEINLVNCRIDFDHAVEVWFADKQPDEKGGICYHNSLFELVKVAVAIYRPKTRKKLIEDVTSYLTAPSGYMMKWRNGTNRSAYMYYQYLHKLGIRLHSDIENLVDAWLIEYPAAFEPSQQKIFLKPARRGRPKNIELSSLMEKAYEMKPELTTKEKERIRKIFYYHRHSLTVCGMVEKFKKYISQKTAKIGIKKHTAGSSQVG